MRNLPLSEADNELTRSLLNLNVICSKTLQKYILSLTPHVEKMIEADLPQVFAVEFDGWSPGDTPLLRSFVCFVYKEWCS